MSNTFKYWSKFLLQRTNKFVNLFLIKRIRLNTCYIDPYNYIIFCVKKKTILFLVKEHLYLYIF
jgi:hypothetical protein